MNDMPKQKIILKGIIANKGKVEGKVRIIDADTINDKKLMEEVSKVKKGDILVTTMTRPIFVTAMRKAVAIIAERGGILCHAAMVAREFNLPCIISAKDATRVLKNSQKVLVDANKGIIYEI